jgi:hypothetical protein
VFDDALSHRIKQTESRMSKSPKHAAPEQPLNLKMLTIGGERFVMPMPYSAGHVCTEGEANALNQTLAENCRNNLSGKAKDGKLSQADVDAYVASYQFGAKGGGFVSNPVESMALQIARRKVKAKGMKASDITQAAHALLASDKGSAIRKAAAAMVEA